MIRILMTLLFLTFAFPVAAQVVTLETPLADEAQEKEAREIMKGLRCLVCQNQSIEDSNAPLARDLRIIVREKLSAGMNKQQIETYLVERYGDWVLMNPPVNNLTIALWVAPLLFVLFGLAIVVRQFRRKESDDEAAPLNEKEVAQLKARLSKGDEA